MLLIPTSTYTLVLIHKPAYTWLIPKYTYLIPKLTHNLVLIPKPASASLCYMQAYPDVDQVESSRVCSLPPDLREFSKQHTVELVSHNDPRRMFISLARRNESVRESWLVLHR